MSFSSDLQASTRELIILTLTVIFATGYGIWNIDNLYCGTLTAAKRSIGMPWSFALELHGWWHIFTGVGAYICESTPRIPVLLSLSKFGIAKCATSKSVYLLSRRRFKLITSAQVIALVEYLTSDEAGLPLKGRFAWPVGLIVTGDAGPNVPHGSATARNSKIE